MNEDHDVFKDLEYIRKKLRETKGPEPIGLTIFPNGTFSLWYGEEDENN